MVVDIYIIPKEESVLTNLGIAVEEGDLTVKFRFPNRKFGGYWIDPDDGKIHFFVDGLDLIAPYSEQLEKAFKDLSSLQ